MYVTPEQIQASARANMEAMLSLATSQFAACEKIASLNAGAFKAAFEDAVANARTLASAKDAQELVSLQGTITQPAIEKTIAYSRSMYEVTTHAGVEASKITERCFAEWKESFATLLDKAAKSVDESVASTTETVKSLSKPRKAA
jgi:phasin family protein